MFSLDSLTVLVETFGVRVTRVRLRVCYSRALVRHDRKVEARQPASPCPRIHASGSIWDAIERVEA